MQGEVTSNRCASYKVTEGEESKAGEDADANRERAGDAI